MKSLYLLFSLFLLQIYCFKKQTLRGESVNQQKENTNERTVVIGILDSPFTRFLIDPNFNKNDTMIPSSYVKLIESTGAHTIRIPHYASKEKLDYFLQNINGLLLTGGSQLVRNQKTKQISEYGKQVQYLLQRIVEINENGQNFPVYGICNGFSQIVCSFSSNEDNLCDILTYRQHVAEMKTITFTKPYVEPFLSMKDYITDVLQKDNQLAFYHSLYLEPKHYNNNTKLNSQFQVSSISSNYKRIEFISSIHHKKYPIFADIFHPEKSAYEWKPIYVSHKKEAILFGYYIAQYFVDEASKNSHKTSEELQKEYLEYKYETNILQTPSLSYESIFVFKRDAS